MSQEKLNDPHFSLFVLWQNLVVSSYRSFFYKLTNRKNIKLALGAPKYFQELGKTAITCAPFEAPFKPNDKRFSYFMLEAIKPNTESVFFLGLGKALRNFFKSSPPKSKRVFLSFTAPHTVSSLLSWLVARLTLGSNFYMVTALLQNNTRKLPFHLRWIESFIFKKSYAILCLRSEQEKILRKKGFQGLCIPFPLWFDSTKFKLAKSSPNSDSATRKIHLGFAGNLSKDRGILDFLGCCEDYSEEWKDSCTIRIVGSGELSSEVKAYGQKLTRAGWTFQYLGPLAKKDMPEFFQNIDILIVPSKAKSSWQEQFGRIIVEAEACGVLVLGSDSGDIPKIINAANRIFKEADNEDMAFVINYWRSHMQSPEERLHVRQVMAKRALETYSDQVLAEKFFTNLANSL